MRLTSRASAFTLIELLVVISIIALLAAILFPAFARVRDNARRSVCQSNLKQIGIGMQQYNQDYDGYLAPSWISPSPSALNKVQTSVWPILLQPYLKSTLIFACPSAGESQDWAGVSSTRDACWAGGVSQFMTVAVPSPARTCYGVNSSIHRVGDSGPSGVDPFNEAALTNPSQTADTFDSVWIDADHNPSASPVVDFTVRIGRTWNRHSLGSNFLYADGHVKWVAAGNLASIVFTP